VRRRRSAALARVALTLTLAFGLALGCHRTPSPAPEDVAYRFRDVFPYPAITGGGDVEAPELRPLLDGYLLYVGREDFSAAAAEFDRVAARHPDLLEARLLQGISLVLAAREAEAVPVLEGVVAARPAYAPARWYLGSALLALGRRADGLAQMEEVRNLGSVYADEASQVLAAARKNGA
jgi:hypothetical protein